MVLTVALGTLLRGFPRLRLAMPVAEPTGAEGTAGSGLEALPVRW
jgi:cytochrome P450